MVERAQKARCKKEGRVKNIKVCLSCRVRLEILYCIIINYFLLFSTILLDCDWVSRKSCSSMHTTWLMYNDRNNVVDPYGAMTFQNLYDALWTHICFPWCWHIPAIMYIYVLLPVTLPRSPINNQMLKASSSHHQNRMLEKETKKVWNSYTYQSSCIFYPLRCQYTAY